ncbi:helix-turn-helix transcriptional regulator [Streptomyces griseochromogenes]|uniref:helix-turn-helix transcriptional regulator n=1 Tax=Streptomyces griseochromogenes TaxID=68214 RepID=UPI0021501F44|nr:helix-turn-helix transcriptional regulator [Streptomyces griseochromogenes]
MRGWRRRLTRDQVPELRRSRQTRSRMVSQEEMAQLTGVSSVWYGKFERGGAAQYSEDFLNRVSCALRLDEAERKLLFLHAVGWEPTSPANCRDAGIADGVRRLLELQPWPAYASDTAWDVIYHNRAFSEWFPFGVAEQNIAKEVFAPDTGRRIRFHNWEQDWAGPMLAQMRMAQARHPENTRLNTVVEEILDTSECARRLWRQHRVAEHADGNRRDLFRVDQETPTTIEIVMTSPLGNGDLRLVSLIPVRPDEGSR